MSPFVIFVIVLTIIYIIYYAVMITRDLYGKKEDHKTQEEVFDVSDMVEEEAAVSVHPVQCPPPGGRCAGQA